MAFQPTCLTSCIKPTDEQADRQVCLHPDVQQPKAEATRNYKRRLRLKSVITVFLFLGTLDVNYRLKNIISNRSSDDSFDIHTR